MRRANYRRGGIFMLPSVIIAVIIAIFVSAPTSALISICVFGFVTALILILVGDRREPVKDVDSSSIAGM